jgi:hypothetical protein
MGDIVTFYSYKGGTGRSMALANVGHILAWQSAPPHKVLMIDWDLEAPGLHRYFYDQLKINFSAIDASRYAEALKAAPGLIDFLQDAKSFYEKEYPSAALGVTHAETEAARTAYMRLLTTYPLSRYTLSIAPPESALQRDPNRGLDLMKAGNQGTSGYINLIRTFDWHGFYDAYGSFFTLLREHLAAEYDTVLIDSRTGLTDIGDICVRVMPEKLVGVFVPNEQNIEGLIQVVRGAAEHRMKSRDPRGLLVYPLASRIDAERSLLRNTWWKGGVFHEREVVGYEPRFEAVIKSVYHLETCDLEAFFDNTQLSYDPDYAFGEEVAARDNLSGRLTISYACANLVHYLVEDCPPWEKLSDGLPKSPPAAKPSVAEPPGAQLRHYWSPLLLAVLGVLLAILGPLIERSGWGTGTASKTSRSLFFEATLSTSTIAGFGIGMAEIRTRITTEDGKPSSLALQLSSSRGTVAPKELVASTSAPALAVVRSEGLGTAEVTIKSTVAGPAVVFQIVYSWPVALTAAVLGGGLVGIGLVLFRLFEGPFQWPSFPDVVALCSISMLLSIMAVLIYIVTVASLVAESDRYNQSLIVAVAAVGPEAVRRYVVPMLLRIVSPTVPVSRKPHD